VEAFPEAIVGSATYRFTPIPDPSKIPFAVLVFAWQGDQILLCNIAGRGWTVPSGRIEPGETSAEAAHRETLEEAGGVLGTVSAFGSFEVIEGEKRQYATCFTCGLLELHERLNKDESTGVRRARLAELPAIYYTWNSLFERVFHHAQEINRSTGTS
jgi:8-oxo-dGTP diphosphatase